MLCAIFRRLDVWWLLMLADDVMLITGAGLALTSTLSVQDIVEP